MILLLLLLQTTFSFFMMEMKKLQNSLKKECNFLMKKKYLSLILRLHKEILLLKVLSFIILHKDLLVFEKKQQKSFLIELVMQQINHFWKSKNSKEFLLVDLE